MRCFCGFESTSTQSIGSGSSSLEESIATANSLSMKDWISSGGWWACPWCGCYYLKFSAYPINRLPGRVPDRKSSVGDIEI